MVSSESGKSKDLVLNIHDVLGDDHKSSVKLTQTTKGVTWEIKVYNDNPEVALRTAERLFEHCQNKYGTVVE